MQCIKPANGHRNYLSFQQHAGHLNKPANPRNDCPVLHFNAGQINLLHSSYNSQSRYVLPQSTGHETLPPLRQHPQLVVTNKEDEHRRLNTTCVMHAAGCCLTSTHACSKCQPNEHAE
jgi:hypothetical protein